MSSVAEVTGVLQSRRTNPSDHTSSHAQKRTTEQVHYLANNLCLLLLFNTHTKHIRSGSKIYIL